jgi:hypothetical protein
MAKRDSTISDLKHFKTGTTRGLQIRKQARSRNDGHDGYNVEVAVWTRSGDGLV